MELLIFTLLILANIVIGIFLYLGRWKKYDPTWLVELATVQYPEDYALRDALNKRTKIRGGHFVNSKRPNKPGSEWQFDHSITLEHPDMGDLALDILKDGRIGSIEYLGLMMKGKRSNKAIQPGQPPSSASR